MCFCEPLWFLCRLLLLCFCNVDWWLYVVCLAVRLCASLLLWLVVHLVFRLFVCLAVWESGCLACGLVIYVLGEVACMLVWLPCVFACGIVFADVFHVWLVVVVLNACFVLLMVIVP